LNRLIAGYDNDASREEIQEDVASDVAVVLAFARAQQAKGLGEAAELCKTKGKMHDMDWWRDAPKTEVSKVTALDLAEIIEAQATAREAGV